MCNMLIFLKRKGENNGKLYASVDGIEKGYNVSFSYDEISSQPVSQIPWGTILTIIHKCSSHDEVMWYINYAYNNRLSRPEVEREIKKGTYLLQLSNTNNSIQINLPVENMFKDTYIIDYPGISINNNEYEFKNKLLENIVVFLNDLGEGFALVGKEYELSIGDSIRKIDLLFYNFHSLKSV